MATKAVEKKYKHAAFISYSHDADPSKGGAFKLLRRFFMTYPNHKKLPKSRNIYIASEISSYLSSRLKKSGTDAYWDYSHSGNDLSRILPEVDNSEKLLVICSNEAMAKSNACFREKFLSWMDLEILRFLFGDNLLNGRPIDQFNDVLLNRLFANDGSDPLEKLSGIFNTCPLAPGRRYTDVIPVLVDGAIPNDNQNDPENFSGYYGPIVLKNLLAKEQNINCADLTNTEVAMRGVLCLAEQATTGTEKNVCIKKFNKKRLSRYMMAFALFLVLIVSILSLVLFERTAYYDNYILENGVAKGVGAQYLFEGSADDHGDYYAITKRGFKTVRLEHIDPLARIGEADGVRTVEYEHFSDGSLSAAYYDYDGTKLGVEHRSAADNGTAMVNVYADRISGLPLTYCPEAEAFIAADLPVDAVRSETSSYIVEYDAAGHDARHVFTVPADNVYGFCYQYDDTGLLTQKRVIVDSNGKLGSGKWYNYTENKLAEIGSISNAGMLLEASERRTYASGQLTGIYSIDLKNATVDGVSIEYDASGRITRRIIRGDSPVAIFAYTYDGDSVTEYQYMSDGKQPAYTDNFCCTRTTVDSTDGKRTETVTYMDENGAIINNSVGYASVVRTFDSDGRIISEEYRDSADASMHITGEGVAYPFCRVEFDYASEVQRIVSFYDAASEEPFARHTYTFDAESGNLLRVVLDSPVTLGNYTYWGYEYSVNGDGVRELTWLDENGRPFDGYADFVAGDNIVTTDDNGRITRELFTDETGSCTYSPKYGCWGFIYAYDENGHEKRRTCIDGDSRPMHSDALGYCYYVISYNDIGWVTRKVYYGLDDDPVISADGTAGYVEEYTFDADFDNNGSFSYIRTYIDDFSNPCIGPDDYAMIEYFVEGGIYVEEHYMDENGQPIHIFSAGCAGKRYIDKTSENGEIIDGFMYLGVDHEPIVMSFFGAAGELSITYPPDENGFFTDKLVYLGADGKPMINTQLGFAMYSAVIDPTTGNAKKCDYMDPEGGLIMSSYGYAGYEYTDDRLFYYDVNREPIDDSEKIYRSDIEYNEQGKIIRLIYKDAYTGKKVIHHEYGYCGFEQVFGDGWMRGYYLGVDEEPMVMENMNGLAGWMQEYNADGIQISHIPLDVNGEPIMRYTENDGFGYSSVRGICDENSKWLELYFYDLEGNNVTVGGAYGEKYDRDEDGEVIGYAHLDFDGNCIDACDEPGGACYAYWKEETVQLDDGGKNVTRSYFSADGSLCFGPYLYSYMTSVYDQWGNHVASYYYAPDGSRLPSVSDGEYHAVFEDGEYKIKDSEGHTIELNWTVLNRYDANGNNIYRAFIGPDSEPCFSETHGYAVMESEYDDYGTEIMRRYTDENGDLVLVKDKGYAMFTEETVDKDTVIITYYDASGKPFVSEDRCYASAKYIFSGAHDKTVMYLDKDNFPMIVEKYGYAGYSITYGEQDGMSTKTKMYLDVDGHPIIGSGGYAGTVEFTNKQDIFVKTMFLGTDGTYTCDTEGCYGYTGEYDDDIDNWIWTIWLDASGKPFAYDGNRAGWRKEYYANGKLKKYTVLGVDGLPIEEHGYSSLVYEYDEEGRMTAQSFYDIDGNPAYYTLYGIHRLEYAYNISGEHCKTTFYDEHCEAMMSPVFGYHGFFYKFNENGNEESQFFFDTESYICTSFSGYAQTEYSYRNGLLSDVRYQDEYGNPALNHEEGAAWVHYTYDENGLCISTEFLDENGYLLRTSYSGQDESEETQAQALLNFAVPNMSTE